jgi:hypothetical protein
MGISMSIRVELSRIEKTLNFLSRVPRQRGKEGFLAVLKEEARILREAFDAERDEAIELAARLVATDTGIEPSDAGRLAVEIRSLKGAK